MSMPNYNNRCSMVSELWEITAHNGQSDKNVVGINESEYI